MLTARLPVSPAARRALWALIMLDALTGAWMAAAGGWFDRTSPLTALATLGGHHDWVLWLAAGSFAVLLGAAVRTGGFVVADGVTRALMALAAGAAVVAAAGLVALAAFVGGVVGLLAVVGRALGR